MIRILSINLFFLLLPTLLYLGYVYFYRRSRPNERVLNNAPIFWLLTAGIALMMGALIAFGRWDDNAPSGHYVPPRIKDGVVIPGHVE